VTEESQNPPVVWGYMLLGEGRPDVSTQRRVMAFAGVDMSEIGTCWDDKLTQRTTRPQSQLEDRNILIKAVQAGDVVHFASLLCLGVSGTDVEWLLGQFRERGVTVVVHDGMDELVPGDDPAPMIENFEKRRVAMMAQRHRSKKAKKSRQEATMLGRLTPGIYRMKNGGLAEIWGRDGTNWNPRYPFYGLLPTNPDDDSWSERGVNWADAEFDLKERVGPLKDGRGDLATDPELLALLERAKDLPPLTPAQIKEQRISFVYGQLVDCAPSVTKDQVRAIDDAMYGRPE